MTFKRFLFITLLFCALNPVFCQNLQEGQKLWSEESVLLKDDFKIRIDDINNDALYSQFSIAYQVGGFSFLSKNLNQKILNIFMGEASWINKAHFKSEVKQLEFQQLQFDLCEVYAREFRKEALINKKKVLKGFDYLQALNNKIMSEFARDRAVLIKETESGRNEMKVREWQENIEGRLKILALFSYENKKKIKLSEI